MVLFSGLSDLLLSWCGYMTSALELTCPMSFEKNNIRTVLSCAYHQALKEKSDKL